MGDHTSAADTVEVWAAVDGLVAYEVSTLGRVRGHRGRILDPKPNARGYVQASLALDRKQVNRLVHVLVANAFVPNLEQKPFVNHINGVRADNRAANLEWVTAAENANRKTKKATHPTRQVVQMTLAGEIVRVWSSALEASTALDAQRSSISACCRGVHGSHHGYRWSYENAPTFEEEVWADVSHKGQMYRVSSEGRVALRGGKMTWGSRAGNYMVVGRHVYVHRLVAQAYCANPESKPCVNHKDGDGSNNRASNLEWVTHQENVAHSAATGLRAPTNPKLRKPVRSITHDGQTSEYPSVTAASEATGICLSKIAATCRGGRKTAGGRRWMYIDGLPTPPTAAPAPIADDDPLWEALGL